MLDVSPSLLRFWEAQIPQICPRKSSKGTRLYSKEDVAILKKVYHLTRECGFTLNGVKEQLKSNDQLDEKMQLVQTLTEVRQYLVELKNKL